MRNAANPHNSGRHDRPFDSVVAGSAIYAW